MPLLHIPALTLWAFALPAPTLSANAAPAAGGHAARLPSGNDSAFRERMLAWSAPDDAETQVAVRIERAQPRPVARLPRLSSRFGYRSDPMRGTARMHSGIDIPGPLGTPIQASAGGIVRFAGTAGGYGHMVEIAHGGGLSTRYAHLSRLLVRPGDAVSRGETIALMGSTGRSTGSHLHFEVRANGHAANPLVYLGQGSPPETVFTQRRAKGEPHISRYARARAAPMPPK